MADADPAQGEKVFGRCKACHVVDKEQNRVGPHLVGIIGREAGSVETFKYSDAMKNSGKTWDEATLAAYLQDPKGYIPGNKMAFPGLKKGRGRGRDRLPQAGDLDPVTRPPGAPTGAPGAKLGPSRIGP